MKQDVSNPPATVLGPRLAADVVSMAREGSRVRLDYSSASLGLVDRIIEAIRGEQPPLEAVAPMLRGFGAYAGEVLVRAVDAAWVDFDEEQRATFGQPFGIRTPDGRVWNPLGKAVKRYENGPADSLRFFCLSAMGRGHV